VAGAAILDFHSHLIPPAWGRGLPLPPALTDSNALLEAKQQVGIGVTVISNAMLNLPGAPIDNRSLDRIKEWNDWAVELTREHRGRILALPGINAFGDGAMLDEMRRAVVDGGLPGVTVHSSVDGRFLGAEEAADFWALADELGVPIFIHPPADPVGAANVSDPRVLEFALRASDVALSAATLLMAEVLGRHPRVRIVCAAGGGGLSALTGRLDIPARFSAPPGSASAEQVAAPSAGLERVYVDTCSFSAPALGANLGLLGRDHVLFGTDSPPVGVPASVTLELLDELEIAGADRDRVLFGNAAELLGIVDPPAD
jgi:aminocarboxymuconate-semialdehyde decarboxylase